MCRSEPNTEKTPDDWIRHTEYLVEKAFEDFKQTMINLVSNNSQLIHTNGILNLKNKQDKDDSQEDIFEEVQNKVQMMLRKI